MAHVVKRHGRKEKFDERKVYASSYAACRAAHMGEDDCEKVADAVAKQVKKWMTKKKVVTSHDIFHEVVRALRKRDKNAAFLYETHTDVS